jgi:putative hemolysin
MDGVWLVGNYSDIISFGLVVLVITYISVIFGELVPKRLALGHSERIACALAPLMRTLARFTTPAVHLLSRSTELVFRLSGLQPGREPPITEEEIKIILSQGMTSGALEHIEKASPIIRP